MKTKNIINHRAIGLFVSSFVWFGVAISFTRPAIAERMGAEIHLEDRVGLTPEERQIIFKSLVGGVEFQTKKSGWKCVRLLRNDDQENTELDELAPLIPTRYQFRVTIDPPYWGHDKFGIFVTVDSPAAKGKEPYPILEIEEISVGHYNRAQALEGKARQALMRALDKMLKAPPPCAPKVKAKVKRTRVGTIVNDHWEAEAHLTLDENGKVITAIPASYRYDVSYASCPQSGAGRGEITLMGAYDGTDNRLVMALALGDGSPLSVGYYFSCRGYPMWVRGGLIGDDVSIALEDGAHFISSGGFAGETWEISLDLSYDTEESEGFPSS